MNGQRLALALGALSALLAGCLFPSFDGMEGDGGPRREDGVIAKVDAGSASPAEGGAPAAVGAASGGASGGVGGGAVDGGAADGASGAPTGPQITCGKRQCTGGSVCCVGITTEVSCKSATTSDFCSSKLFCDDATDCSAGQVCCAFLGEARCTSAADCGLGAVLCDPKAPQCPSNQPKCSGTLFLAPELPSTFCMF